MGEAGPAMAGATTNGSVDGSAMRVIAGTLGGRRLRAPKGLGTRPTPDRVREALFAALEPIAELRVLDLYSGSGALGIEAVSRGAAHVVMVERSRAALGTLRGNLQELRLGAEITLLAAAVEHALGSISQLGPYDLVLADPPYADVASGQVAAVLGQLLERQGMLAPTGRVVLEHAARDPAPELRTVRLERTRKYGDTALSLYLPHDTGVQRA
jgi:16S rRNA (guanine966-N2)-methyltransferase